MNVIFYQKEDGTAPAKEFLKGLDPKMRAKVARTVNQLITAGHSLPSDFKKSW